MKFKEQAHFEFTNIHIIQQEGVRYGSLGLTIFAAVTMGCSLIYPILSRIFGIKTVFFASQLILALCLTLPVWIHSKIGAILIISACGVPWTAVMVFPFTLGEKIIAVLLMTAICHCRLANFSFFSCHECE